MRKIVSLLVAGLLCTTACLQVIAMQEFNHSSVVNAINNKVKVTIVTNERTNEADVATLRPGAVWEYGEKRINGIIIDIFDESGERIGKPIERTFNKFGLFVVRKWPSADDFDLAGPGYGEVVTGVLYLINATPHTITYHVGYNACSTKEGRLDPYARNIVRLGFGLCRTDNVHGWYFVDGVKKWVVPDTKGYSSGVFVYRETSPGSNLIEVKRFLLGPYTIWW